MQAEKDKPKTDDKPQAEPEAHAFSSEWLIQLLVIVVILVSMGIPLLDQIKSFWRNSIVNRGNRLIAAKTANFWNICERLWDYNCFPLEFFETR